MNTINILYASQTGNTEGIIRYLDLKLKERGIDTVIFNYDDYSDDFFDDTSIIVIATYTDGLGDLPYELEEVYEEIQERKFQNKKFAVIGSGDKLYGLENFCKAADLFNEVLLESGMDQIFEVIKIENSINEDDQVLLDKLVEKVMIFQ